MNRPEIAVLLEDNFSGDAIKYKASKRYLPEAADADGIRFGIPYLQEVFDSIIHDINGLLTVRVGLGEVFDRGMNSAAWIGLEILTRSLNWPKFSFGEWLSRAATLPHRNKLAVARWL